MTSGEGQGLSRSVQALDKLFRRVVAILEGARARVVRSINNEMVVAYWHIGREIVEHVQAGEGRAEYGKRVIEDLADLLSRRYGRGFSSTNLRYFRTFYEVYTDRQAEIRHTACGALEPVEEGAAEIRHPSGGALDGLELAIEHADRIRGFSPQLGWSHYRTLMRVDHTAERLFYEVEAEQQNWSVRELERQIDSLLFARLLKSHDKGGLLDLAKHGQVIERPADALKDPYVLDFLDLPDGGTLRESELEAAILRKLQSFLLELGKGFAFVAQQRRLTFEDEHFYIDLVFYNTVLKCFLLIDLKVGKLSHQDIGQMDSYIRLFDDQCTSDDDNATIGLILCARKNEAIARYSVLSESKQIFAARYVQVLPTEEELRLELERERHLLEMEHGSEPKPKDH